MHSWKLTSLDHILILQQNTLQIMAILVNLWLIPMDANFKEYLSIFNYRL